MFKTELGTPILRRMSLFYKENTRKINLLTIIEQIEPDMPDHDFKPQNMNHHRGDIGIEMEDVVWKENWIESVDYWQDRINDHAFYTREPQKGNLVLTREFDESGLTSVLPFRKGPYYAVVYRNKQFDSQPWVKDESKLAELSQMTTAVLGYDVTKSLEWLGCIIMVWYHPVIRDIQFTGTDSPSGMLCTISTRRHAEIKLIFTVTDRDEEGNIIGEPLETVVDVRTRKFLLSTRKPVTRPDVEVRDEQGQLVYVIRKIVFIKRIVLNVGVMDGVTGEKRAVMERDIIVGKPSKDQTTKEAKRAEVTKKVMALLRQLPQEEAEIAIDEVKKKMEGK